MKLCQLLKELGIQLLLGLFDMNDFYVRKILNDDQLNEIKNVLTIANSNNSWIDGLNSGGGIRSVKNNLELSDFNLLKIINDLIMKSLDLDSEFISFAVPKSTNLNIISKTTSGSYYNPHLDNWNNGDYSTTVFLNDPKDYQGGELCLLINGEEVMFKLDPGWGITYSTGIIHRVNRVVSGSRYVSVFWTESLIRDDFIRYIYTELSRIERVVNTEKSIHLSTCMSASKDPGFCINNLKHQLLRKFHNK